MMSDKQMLVLRVELEGVRQTVNAMLQDGSDAIKSMIAAELEKKTTPESIQMLVTHCVEGAVEAAVKKAVESFFVYGEGQRKIREIAHAHLDMILGVQK